MKQEVVIDIHNPQPIGERTPTAVYQGEHFTLVLKQAEAFSWVPTSGSNKIDLTDCVFKFYWLPKRYALTGNIPWWDIPQPPMTVSDCGCCLLIDFDTRLMTNPAADGEGYCFAVEVWSLQKNIALFRFSWNMDVLPSPHMVIPLTPPSSLMEAFFKPLQEESIWGGKGWIPYSPPKPLDPLFISRFNEVVEFLNTHLGADFKTIN